jgi:fatty acid desaturase
MSPVTSGERKHAGSRKAPRSARTRRPLDPKLLIYAAGITFCVVAWGYLVYAAIDFGGSARAGRSAAWMLLLVACIGAACCLFAGLMLAVRALTLLGIVSPPPGPSDHPAPTRAARDVSAPAVTPSRHSGTAVHDQPSLARTPGGRRAAR